MRLLRIAVALPHLGVYGGIRRFLELGNVWRSRGHDVALLIPRGVAAREPWIPFSGRVGTLDELGAAPWDALLSPDPALFLASRAPGALRAFYAVLEGAPGEDAAIRSADLVLANSAGMRRYVMRRGIQPIDAAGGVNVGFFRPREPDPRNQRALAGAPVRALVYGRLSRKRKGSWAAARAVERAGRATGVPVTLTLFDAPQGGARSSEAGGPMLPRRLTIAHRWAINPTQAELRDLYADADVFVAAERRAGWCNTAAEAMACGAALVCTRSGTEDFAIDGATAAVCRGGSPRLLARALAPLLRDPEARAAMRARGRVRIAEYSWERTAERIERALLDRLGGTRDVCSEGALAP